MAAPESWEDMETQPSNPGAPSRLNANAPSFSWNVNAPVFAPNNAYYGRPPPGQNFYPGNPNMYVQPPYMPQPSPYPAMGAYNRPPVMQHPDSQFSARAPPAASTNLPSNQPKHVVIEAREPTDTGKQFAETPNEGIKKKEANDNAVKSEEKMEIDSGSVTRHTDAKESSSRSTNGPANDEEKIVSGVKSLKVKDAKPSQESAKHDESPEETFEDLENDETYKKPHMNVVFIGHVDAGKSTIGGQILFISNMVDERTIQKYEKEAKDKNRESWYMAYIMDTNEEERTKGITVEVGRAHFETEKTRVTILDAPGHKSYVPNMISGASQADVAVLVISARKGEFETGFERGGQTREHAMLAKTLGVFKLICVVNKMDDATVQWSKERYDDIEKKLTPFLKSCGYNVKKDVQFLPISGLIGANIKDRMPKTICEWWEGPCLFEAIDGVQLPPRDPRGPVRMPIIDKFKDMGTVVMGKIESGTIRQGSSLMVMPNKARVKVVSIYHENVEVKHARPGENVRVKLSGIEEDDISAGFVLSSAAKAIPSVTEFDAQLQILELLDHKAIFTAGYKAVLHIHSVVEECEIIQLLEQIDQKTKKPMKKKPLFVKSGAVVVCRVQVNDTICVEKFSDFPQLGRFTLRDEGKTVAIGKVVKLPNAAA
eukprot:TRINITY_DN660_c0_g1_i1.p1 TRINITY_DN660_c0_g1~~TRINITY_DN660_c0_g1_i1.p1  ORF type:complete len:675 (-),score=129.06 TRINITY_DN660_c0_g1_i1:417-2384(-)